MSHTLFYFHHSIVLYRIWVPSSAPRAGQPIEIVFSIFIDFSQHIVLSNNVEAHIAIEDADASYFRFSRFWYFRIIYFSFATGIFQ